MSSQINDYSFVPTSILLPFQLCLKQKKETGVVLSLNLNVDSSLYLFLVF